MEPISTLFFHFSAAESKNDLVKRLQAAKENGFCRIIASYKTKGMEQAKFDETYMNKASMGDGTPAELFHILKDDAVKVLHSICQQIWKTPQ